MRNSATGSVKETKPLAEWALKTGIKNVYSLVLDYSAGLDAANSFQTTFTAGGGKIAGELHVPQNSPDFSAYIQRIKEAKPQAVFAFLSISGGPFLKAWDCGWRTGDRHQDPRQRAT